MNTIVPTFVRPVADLFNSLVVDQNLKELLSFKGGQSAGNDWHSKSLRNEREQINNQFVSLERKFKNAPELVDVLWDNKWRLTVLAGMERLFSIRQAQGFLKSRFFMGDTNTSALQAVFNQGTFRGYFKGYFAHLLHFFGTQYHAALFAHGKSYKDHLLVATAFEFVLYPLDTLRTLVQTDLANNFNGYRDCLAKTMEKGGLEIMFRGVSLKLAYNAAYILNLRNLYDENTVGLAFSYPLWLASYALLTLKTRYQVCDSSLTFQSAENKNHLLVSLYRNVSLRNLYAGLVPFAVVNTLFSYTFYGLYSQAAQTRELQKLQDEFNHKFTNPGAERNWS